MGHICINKIFYKITRMALKNKINEKINSLPHLVRISGIGFVYGFVFGSTIGILGNLQYLNQEKIKTGRRFVNVAKGGCTWGIMCGIIVSAGFIMNQSRHS